MLPSPASSRRRPRKPSYLGISTSNAWSYRLHLLSQRSRVTNLAVLLLAAAFFFSLSLNIRHSLAGLSIPYGTQWDVYGVVKSIEDTIERTPELQRLDHLIMVPGHGVWTGNSPEEILHEDTWALENYQSGEGAKTRIEAFIGHIRKGVQLADTDPNSLLVFSGGSTRTSTPLSESTSYLSLAIALSLLTPSSHSRLGLNTYARTATEEYALDSFQNLIFSVARFREVTGHYPKHVTVVGYALKEARFTELHRSALRWPVDRWEYSGIDMEDATLREEAMKGENTNGYLPYLRDLYGCHGSLLAKRRSRNVYRKAHPYHGSAPEIAQLLEWCPDTSSGWKFAPDSDSERSESGLPALEGLYQGPLPWDGL